MTPLFKKIATAILLVGIVSFVKLERKSKHSTLDIKKTEVLDILSTHTLYGRPDGNYSFFVETDLIQKVRGAKKVNAKVYIIERATGKTSLLASENVQIQNYPDAISIETHPMVDNFEVFALENGDKVIGCSSETPFQFRDLMAFDTIYNSYIRATNTLLNIERTL